MLEFVSQYVPDDKNEVYDIMNALDDRLGTPNSAVVLATVKVFLNLTLAMPYDHQQVSRHPRRPCGAAPGDARLDRRRTRRRMSLCNRSALNFGGSLS